MVGPALRGKASSQGLSMPTFWTPWPGGDALERREGGAGEGGTWEEERGAWPAFCRYGTMMPPWTDMLRVL